jgi:hypothetical protein
VGFGAHSQKCSGRRGPRLSPAGSLNPNQGTQGSLRGKFRHPQVRVSASSQTDLGFKGLEAPAHRWRATPTPPNGSSRCQLISKWKHFCETAKNLRETQSHQGKILNPVAEMRQDLWGRQTPGIYQLLTVSVSEHFRVGDEGEGDMAKLHPNLDCLVPLQVLRAVSERHVGLGRQCLLLGWESPAKAERCEEVAVRFAYAVYQVLIITTGSSSPSLSSQKRLPWDLNWCHLWPLASSMQRLEKLQ